MEHAVEVAVLAVALALLVLSVVVPRARPSLRGASAITGVVLLAALLVM